MPTIGARPEPQHPVCHGMTLQVVSQTAPSRSSDSLRRFETMLIEALEPHAARIQPGTRLEVRLHATRVCTALTEAGMSDDAVQATAKASCRLVSETGAEIASFEADAQCHPATRVFREAAACARKQLAAEIAAALFPAP